MKKKRPVTLVCRRPTFLSRARGTPEEFLRLRVARSSCGNIATLVARDTGK
jgi:hypothetical protein